MCIATVCINDAGEMEKVMQDVVSIESDDSGIMLITLLGEEKLLTATIKHVDFLKHTVTVESR